jgi:hypothetical protein
MPLDIDDGEPETEASTARMASPLRRNCGNSFQGLNRMVMMALVRMSNNRRDETGREALVQRVRSEFEEMPCMRLTARQAQRLFGLRRDVCERVLETLVREGTLCRCNGNQYRLNESSPWLGSRAARTRPACATPMAS